jgi:hypothetical protein
MRRRNRNQIARRRSGHATLLDAPKAGTLGSTLPDLIVRLWCTACGHSVDAHAGLLAVRHGHDLPLERLRRRARCTLCGAREANLQIVPDIARLDRQRRYGPDRDAD